MTDCKSVYDVVTRTAIPSCNEYRTTLECLLIRERLQENVQMRWISTQAMLADSLTKSMDSSMLRECLRTGRYSLFDEQESLKQRASKRERLQWLREEGPKVDMDKATKLSKFWILTSVNAPGISHHVHVHVIPWILADHHDAVRSPSSLRPFNRTH